MRQDRIRLVNELNAEDLKKAREKALRDAKKRQDSGAKQPIIVSCGCDDDDDVRDPSENEL